MTDLKQKIAAFVEPLLVPFNAFLVEVKVLPAGKRTTVDVFIDTDKGITIDQCADISKQLGAAIETENLFADAYLLQVSSPGLNKPLMISRQYKKNIGRICKVSFMRDGQRSEWRGTLTSASDVDAMFTDATGNQATLLFSEIIECYIELPW
ncbi:MAG TPA: ribosome maturation factor RimP [Bacteroidota bacterium]|nr:ribosome maturation factor RimP [Bacteroidota bacterium]